MRPEAKDKLLEFLNLFQNNFMTGMAATYLLEQPESWDLLEGAYIGFVPAGLELKEENFSYKFPVHAATNALRKESLRHGLLLGFRNMLFRTLLAETIEHVREYCEGTHQKDKLLASDWYNFARLIRNAETHDGTLRFDKKAKPPVIFKQWHLDGADEGKQLAELITIPNTTAVPILESARLFVKKELA
ncbi:MAG TPA: hypothetical protein VGJ81_05055 [Thermoanaerobaculia bacterium]|jgi:hypothetical protein